MDLPFSTLEGYTKVLYYCQFVILEFQSFPVWGLVPYLYVSPMQHMNFGALSVSGSCWAYFWGQYDAYDTEVGAV